MTSTDLLRQWACLSVTSPPAPLPPVRCHSWQYTTYLQSAQWREKSDACLRRANYRCEHCKRQRGNGVVLQAHHKTYDRLFHEMPDDLSCLCIQCHIKADRLRKAVSRSNYRR